MTLLIPTLGFLQPGACSKLEQSFKKNSYPLQGEGSGKGGPSSGKHSHRSSMLGGTILQMEWDHKAERSQVFYHPCRNSFPGRAVL